MSRALHAPTQVMTGSFLARTVDVFFLFGFLYSCFFIVYLCNGLILYELLGGF
jgi:thiosulfate reductase cytochrome b subunit